MLKQWIRSLNIKGERFLFLYILFFTLILTIAVSQNIEFSYIDPDYHYTMQAFASHQTPEILPSDIDRISKISPSSLGGTVLNEYGQRFGHHFWLWPLLCTPVYVLFEYINGTGPHVAHTITISILLLITMVFVAKYLNTTLWNRFVFLLLFSISPILWYVIPTGGTEDFIVCCLTFSIIAITNASYKKATLMLSIGSLQLTSLLPVAVVFALYSVLSSGITSKNVLKSIAALSPAFISPVFYYLTIGRWSLFAGLGPMEYSDLNPRLALTELFDLNQGMINFMPLLVLSYLFFLVYYCLKPFHMKKWNSIFVSSDNIQRLIILLTPIAVSIVTSVVGNWFCGHVGVMRYAMHFLPFLVFSITCIASLKIRLIVAVLQVSVMLAWLGVNGNLFWENYGLQSDNEYVHYYKPPYSAVRPWYAGVMRYTPSLVPLWSAEMFAESMVGDGQLSTAVVPTNHPLYPFVYYDKQNGIRSMLTTSKALSYFIDGFDFENSWDVWFLKKAAKNIDTPYYVDFPWFSKTGEVTLKRHPELHQISKTLSIQVPSNDFLQADTFQTFYVNIANTSKLPLLRVPNLFPQEHFLYFDVVSKHKSLPITITDKIPLEQNIYPGEEATIVVNWKTPSIAGEYTSEIRILQDGEPSFDAHPSTFFHSVDYFKPLSQAMLQKKYLFGASVVESGDPFIQGGWCPPESTHIWSSGNYSQIAFAVSEPIVSIEMDVGFLQLPVPDFTVWLNGEQLSDIVVGDTFLRLSVPEATQVSLRNGGVVDLVFEFPNSATPKSLGINTDPRVLFMALQGLLLK